MNKSFVLIVLISIVISTSFAFSLPELSQSKIDSTFPKLISSTEQCLTDCQATFTYCLDSDSSASLDFKKSKGDVKISYGWYEPIVEKYSYDGACLDEEKVDVFCADNETAEKDCKDYSYTKCNKYEQLEGERTYSVFHEGLPSEKKGCYNVTIFGKKGIHDNVDWIPTLTTKGLLYDTEISQRNWAWWNMSWNYCKNITISANTGGDVNYTDYPSINISGGYSNFTGLKFNSTDELRIVNAPCSETGTEIARNIISNTTTSAEILFYFNKTLGTDNIYSIYYDNPTAPTPSYTSMFSIANKTQINVTNGNTWMECPFSDYPNTLCIRNATGYPYNHWSSSTNGGFAFNFIDSAPAFKYHTSVGAHTVTQVYNGTLMFSESKNKTYTNITYYNYKNFFDGVIARTTRNLNSANEIDVKSGCSATAKTTINNSAGAYATYTSGVNSLTNNSENWGAFYCNNSNEVLGVMSKNMIAGTVITYIKYGTGGDTNAYSPQFQIGLEGSSNYPITNNSILRYTLISKDSSQSGDAQYYVPIQQEYNRFVYGTTFVLGDEQGYTAPLVTNQLFVVNGNVHSTSLADCDKSNTYFLDSLSALVRTLNITVFGYGSENLTSLDGIYNFGDSKAQNGVNLSETDYITGNSVLAIDGKYRCDLGQENSLSVYANSTYLGKISGDSNFSFYPNLSGLYDVTMNETSTCGNTPQWNITATTHFMLNSTGVNLSSNNITNVSGCYGYDDNIFDNFTVSVTPTLPYTFSMLNNNQFATVYVSSNSYLTGAKGLYHLGLFLNSTLSGCHIETFCIDYNPTPKTIVSITSPSVDSYFARSSNVKITFNVTDDFGTVPYDYTVFLVKYDNATPIVSKREGKINSNNSATIDFGTVEAGKYNTQVSVEDSDNNLKSSNIVTFEVGTTNDYSSETDFNWDIFDITDGTIYMYLAIAILLIGLGVWFFGTVFG